MNKIEFLGSELIRSFIRWVEPRLNTPGSFRHGYRLKSIRTNWGCESLYSACEGYKWPFKDELPEGISVSGITFRDSYDFLGRLSEGLRQSIDNNDPNLCQEHCLAILNWAGFPAVTRLG